MNHLRLVVRSFGYFLPGNLATSVGLAIATAVVCGAMIIGDSLTKSLEQIVDHRLGMITHTITAGDRIFTESMGRSIDSNPGMAATTVLQTEAVVTVQGSQLRANQVNIYGITDCFPKLTEGLGNTPLPKDNELIINQYLAGALQVDTGDYLLVRMKRIGAIPANTPLVSDADQTITRRVRISAIVDQESMGNFSTKASQSAVYNAFVNFNWLNRIMDMNNRANMVLVRADQGISTRSIAEALQNSWRLSDAGMEMDTVNWHGNSRMHLLSSERVFIDSLLWQAVTKAMPGAISVFTYFVNTLSLGDKETPYSFVAGLHALPKNTENMPWKRHIQLPLTLQSHQVAINQWLADDLTASVGDQITLSYYEMGALRELNERSITLDVAAIIPMGTSQYDSILMPHLPGLSDAGNCRDWDAGIPIDLDAIRQKDEDYWENHRGTPKAYISFELAQSLWKNRFGSLTALLIPFDSHSTEEIERATIEHIGIEQLGFQVNSVREQGLVAARNGVDFGQLFAALGIFIIISGLLISVLLLGFSLQQRTKQINLFSTLGFRAAMIQKIIMWEAFAVVLTGVVIGVGASLGYSKLVFQAMNTNWHDIVRTESLQLHFNATTLASGMFISLVIGMATVFLGIRQIVKKHLATSRNRVSSPREGALETQQVRQSKSPSWFWQTLLNKREKTFLYIAILGVSVALCFVSYMLIFSRYDWLFAWFFSGIMLLMALLTGMVHLFLFRGALTNTLVFNLTVLSTRNLMRNPLRSMTTVVLLALGSFVIVVTAANRKDPLTEDAILSSGTGGFQYMIETTIPILHNLNLKSTRTELGLQGDARFVQFLSTYNDDASCLNLNMVANPRILATDPMQLRGRFGFVASHDWLNREDPWMSLNEYHQGLIPAIADQSVIQWGLGKKVGDTLVYANARGEEVKLLLVGGLANSIFQGNVIISETNFLKHFPAGEGSQVMLIEYHNENREVFEEQMAMIFRDHGMLIKTTLDKLSEFDSVENTYLQIFFLMGAFGMLLGTIGLAIIMGRSMLERRSEIVLFRAIGYRAMTIFGILFREYSLLFVGGMAAGTISAMIATLPNFITATQNVSIQHLVAVVIILVLNGLFWLTLIPILMIKQPQRLT